MIKLENISKSYDNKVILDNLSLNVLDGQTVCIYGPSGIGKTTILKIIAGILLYEGKIDPTSLKISYVFQEPRLVGSLTILENLLLINSDRNMIEKLINEFGLENTLNQYPKELSGGEKARINIIRAILNNGDVFLLDEPFSSLDTALKLKIINILKTYLKQSKGNIFVTHDLDEAVMLADKICLLNKNIYKEFDVLDGKDIKKEVLKYISIE